MQQQQQQINAEALQYAQLDPFQRATAGFYKAGAQIPGAVAGLMGVQDPQLAAATTAQKLAGQFDTSTAEGLQGLSRALLQAGQQTGNPLLANFANMTNEKARSLVNEGIKLDLTRAQIEAEGRKNAPKTPDDILKGQEYSRLKAVLDTLEPEDPRRSIIENQLKFLEPKAEKVNAEEQAARTRLQQLQTQFGPEEGANKFRQEVLQGKVKVSAASAPAGTGEVKVADLSTAVGIVEKYTKTSSTQLQTVQQISALIDEVKNNPVALPQLQRQLVTLARDSQIGQNEVKQILGSKGFAADIVDGVTKFLTGAPTNVKIDDIAKAVKAIEGVVGEQYNQGVKKSRTVLNQARFTNDVVDALVPPAYDVNRKTTSSDDALVNKYLKPAKPQ
jgi:hypothetical protein